MTKYTITPQERDEDVDAVASDGVRVRLHLTVRFQVVAAEVVKLDQEIGPRYYEVLVAPTVQAQARRAAARLPADATETSQRYDVERQIREGARSFLVGRYVEVESVRIHPQRE